MIAITGASGFVGRALCETLRSREIAIRPLVRTASDLNFDVMPVGDIGIETNWSNALEGVDCIIHCAARVHVMQDSVEDPLEAFRAVNVAGTLRLAEQAAAMGVRRLVFLSSVKVNGESTGLGSPFFASDIPAPQDAYGISKHEAEQELWQVAKKTGLEVVVVRPPLVYGPGVRANFLRLMRLVARGVPLPLGRVDNLRSLVALDNLVDLLIRCANHPAAAGQTFLVSDGKDISTPELIFGLAKTMECSTRLLPVPIGWLRLGARLTGRMMEVERLVGSLQVDVQHTCKTLDWLPPVSVEEGLRRVCKSSWVKK